MPANDLGLARIRRGLGGRSMRLSAGASAARGELDLNWFSRIPGLDHIACINYDDQSSSVALENCVTHHCRLLSFDPWILHVNRARNNFTYNCACGILRRYELQRSELRFQPQTKSPLNSRCLQCFLERVTLYRRCDNKGTQTYYR